MSRPFLEADPVDRRRRRSFYLSRSQAKFRGEPWALTRLEFYQLWADDDQFLNRGKKIDSWCMVRIDVKKPWTLTNIEIVPRSLHLARQRGMKKPRKHNETTG